MTASTAAPTVESAGDATALAGSTCTHVAVTSRTFDLGPEVPRIPRKYTELGMLNPTYRFNLFAVVVSAKPVTKSRGTDFVCSLLLRDASTGHNSGLRALLFRRKEELPVIDTAGTVVILNDMKIQTFNKSLQAISTSTSTFATFVYTVKSASNAIRWTSTDSAHWITNEDKRAADALRRWWLKTTEHSGLPVVNHNQNGAATIQISRRPLCKTFQLQPNVFVDYIGEVIKINGGGNPTELFVTDYSAHERLKVANPDFPLYSEHDPALNDNERERTWIWGRRLLQLFLWDEHAEFFAGLGVHPGEVVRFNNVRAKISAEDFLELNLHGDPIKTISNKLFVVCPGSLEYDELQDQREGFFRLPIKDDVESVNLVSLSPEQSNLNPAVHDDPDCSAGPVQAVRPSCWSVSVEPETVGGTSTKYNDFSFSSIMQMKAQKGIGLFRIRARVIGIMPAVAEQFCRPFCKDCDATFDPTPETPESCTNCQKPMDDRSFAFRFTLKLLDADADVLNEVENDKVEVIAFGDDAVDLLSGLAPSNLFKDRDTCRLLRERLRRILPELIIPLEARNDLPAVPESGGNAFEVDDADSAQPRKRLRISLPAAGDPSAVYHEFLVKSYDVRVNEDSDDAAGEQQRRYRVWGTVIEER